MIVDQDSGAGDARGPAGDGVAGLVDIGLNLASDRFDHDREAVLDKAVAAGVDRWLLTGTSVAVSEQVARLCESLDGKYPGRLRCTVGVHPHGADHYQGEAREQLLALARENAPWVAAIGETGLDFNRNFSTPAAQERAFESQLELAATVGLPVFLHERDAAERQWQILRAWRDHLSGAVLHCFTGDRRALYRYLDLDLHIGVTGWICDERRGQPLQALVGDIPLERLLIETDAPWLTPRTLKPKPKGGRNEPAFLPEVLKAVATHRPESEQRIARATRDNALRLFWPPTAAPGPQP